MMYLYGFAFLGLTFSAFSDMSKTKKSLESAWRTFVKILPLLLFIVAITSVILYWMPGSVIAKHLGTSDLLLGTFLAALMGSISLLPGFITFPLCGLLLDQGVSYTVLAVFSTTLMMVGIITYPIEKKYFGAKVTILRNVSSFITALLVSIVIGLLYGEVM